MPSPNLEILVLNALQDNFVFLLRDAASGTVAVVDPSEAKPVLEALRARGWPLHYLINTHHHWDHVGGNEELRKVTGAKIVASAYDGSRGRINGVEMMATEGTPVNIGAFAFHPIEIPGHTLGHVAYFVPAAKVVFTGDTLFSFGCGRLFEGTPGQMWESLKKLRALPDETLVYCGHEYTAANLKFALSLEPENAELRAKAQALKFPSVPSRLGEEKRLNPFLRADDPALARALNLETSGPVKVFTELRRRKDHFRA